MRAARLERRNEDAAGAQLHDLLLNQQLSASSDYELGYSSDSASVGAPTRTRHRNDQPAPAFDIDASA